MIAQRFVGFVGGQVLMLEGFDLAYPGAYDELVVLPLVTFPEGDIVFGLHRSDWTVLAPRQVS
jgi:hypothetical protein